MSLHPVNWWHKTLQASKSCFISSPHFVIWRQLPPSPQPCRRIIDSSPTSTPQWTPSPSLQGLFKIFPLFYVMSSGTHLILPPPPPTPQQEFYVLASNCTNPRQLTTAFEKVKKHGLGSLFCFKACLKRDACMHAGTDWLMIVCQSEGVKGSIAVQYSFFPKKRLHVKVHPFKVWHVHYFCFL